LNVATKQYEYAVSGMTCAGCARKISNTLNDMEGVLNADVTLSPPKVRLIAKDEISARAVNDALQAIGNYSVEERSDMPAEHGPPAREPAGSLYPLFLIVAYIAGAVGVLSFAYPSQATLASAMTNFMAGFFLVFSFFKLLDLKGFADAYRSYDLLARAAPIWGFVYPFVELALGIAYLLRLDPIATNAATLVLMAVGSLGVLRALLDRRIIRCACLGTVLNLPMTIVTAAEDLGMATMAALMLVMATR